MSSPLWANQRRYELALLASCPIRRKPGSDVREDFLVNQTSVREFAAFLWQECATVHVDRCPGHETISDAQHDRSCDFLGLTDAT